MTTLDQSFTLPCGVTLKNRLLKSAMSESLGTLDNRVTSALPVLYGRWARGGIGTLVTGNVMIDARALGEPHVILLEDDRDAALLTEWATAGSENGTQHWMQLNHPGKQVPRGLCRETVSPSAVPFGPDLARFFSTPRALTESEIEDLVERFGRSARLAKQAGFTGVQIHGAHGYLVSQFLSPRHNRRDDAWGGTPERRMRFVVEVYKSIRAAVGERFPVSIKLNSADFQKGGFSEEESLDVVSALSELGIDLIEISGGTYEAPAMAAGVPQRDSTRMREAYFLEFAEKVRLRTRIALAVTGGFRTREGVDAALASGALDVAGLARSLVLDPELPNRWLAGESVNSQVKPLRTGISLVDKAGLMEVAWYARQLHRLGKGLEPRPNENLRLALVSILAGQTFGGMRTRMRAS